MKKSTLLYTCLSAVAALLISFTGCSQLGTGTVDDFTAVDAARYAGANHSNTNDKMNVIYTRYLTAFKGLTESEINKYTHIILFNLKLNQDGSLPSVSKKFGGSSNDRFDPSEVRSFKKDYKYKGKLLLCFGSDDKYLREALYNVIKSESKLKTLVENLSSAVEDLNLDGIDIDWEYHDDSECKKYNWAYAELVSKLYDKFKGTNKVITMACVQTDHFIDKSSTSYYQKDGSKGKNPIHNIFSKVEALNIMCYNPDSFQETKDTMTNYVNKGIDKSKLVMGLPFYGEEKDGDSMGYIKLLSEKGDVESSSVYKEKESGYTAVLKSNSSFYVVNTKTLVKRVKYAKDNDFGGIMVFVAENDYDIKNSSNSHNNALKRAVNNEFVSSSTQNNPPSENPPSDNNNNTSTSTTMVVGFSNLNLITKSQMQESCARGTVATAVSSSTGNHISKVTKNSTYQVKLNTGTGRYTIDFYIHIKDAPKGYNPIFNVRTSSDKINKLNAVDFIKEDGTTKTLLDNVTAVTKFSTNSSSFQKICTNHSINEKKGWLHFQFEASSKTTTSDYIILDNITFTK